ncbi:MAG TPA: hypothetical protein VHE78_11795 [Gemmatimonadaceae bacterium]|nr:hypothetical protein [Gemmatimonadaceae bacterium]
MPGGETDRAYANRFVEWGYGTAICLGVAVIVVVLARSRMRRAESPLPANGRGVAGGLLHLRLPGSVVPFFSSLIPLAALVLYAVIAKSVFSGRPLLIDEIVQLFQARIFAHGALWLPVEAHREFFSMLHVVDTGGKVYSQFPPGGPAMLALGELVNTPWIVGPVCGAVSVALFDRLVRLTDPDASVSYHLGAVLLFAVAPFGVFMFGSHMNHATALMWLLVATLGLAHATMGAAGRRRLAGAFACGSGLGAAASIRPLDALAFALPAAAWILALAWRDRRRWAEVVVAGAGLILPFGAMMWVNARSTGSPLLFGYEVLWGKAHGLGFHTAPWGAAHTPMRGLELLSLYVTRLQTYLFETPFPSLLPALVALGLTRRISPLDRYLLVSAVLLGCLYFAYWHDGFFLGPRFVFPWLPVLVLWTARLPRLLRKRITDARLVSTGVSAFVVTGAVMALVASVPVRVTQYRGGLTSMRIDYTAEAAHAQASDALVFVRESWGAQLVTRLWARGVSRSAAAALYHGVDACALDGALRVLERDGVHDAMAESRLAPLLSDSSAVRPSPFSPDSTEKVLPGAAYDEVCVARINEDRAGYTHLAPLQLERGSNNVYARDLQAHDSLLLTEYPSRRVYLLRRKRADPDAPLEWIPLRRDSLFRAWRDGAR